MSTLTDLIPSILGKTTDGKLNWEELTSDSFVARLGPNTFELGVARNGLRLAFLDEAGRVLESASYEHLAPPLNGMLTRLYQVVRRRSLRIDEQLDAAKDILDKL